MAIINSNGTGGGNWSAGASWSGGIAPVAGDTAVIRLGDTITVDDLARAAFKVQIGEVGSTGTLRFAAFTKLTLDNVASAGISFFNTGQVTDNIGTVGTKAEITSAGGLEPANRWSVTVDINSVPDWTARRVQCTGCLYGLVNSLFLFRSLSIRNLRASQAINIVQHLPLGSRVGSTYWKNAGPANYSAEFLYDYDADPFLLDTLIRFGAQNTNFLFIGDLVQDKVFVSKVPRAAAIEMRKDWLTLEMIAVE